METFKETFSTNLFENSAYKNTKRNPVLSPKPIVPAAKGKVLTPAEFEKLRQQAEDESDEEDEEDDVAHDETYQADIQKQRRRQQAALSVYRQQMTKVVGVNASPQSPSQRPLSQMETHTETDDESDEIPLGILMAHGFPQTNNRPSSVRSATPNSSNRTPSPGNLPAFAKNLPADPYASSLPRSMSAFDLGQPRAVSRQSMNPRMNSAPTVTLLQSYQTRQRKGAMFLDPNADVEIPSQMMAQEPSYFTHGPGQYEVMGMQPVPAQGMIQYVPVMVTSPVTSPSLAPMQPPTLMQELHDRQQFGAQRQLQSRMSQYNLQAPQPMYTSQPSPQIPIPRPPSVYHDPRRSFYDQRSIYSSTSQQPTARPKLPSSNPAHRMSTIANNNNQPGRYRASAHGGSGFGTTQSLNRRVSPTSPDDDDEGWESLRRKKEEMAMRRMSRMQTAA